MCTEVNSVMGLQATAATKRKHEITFDGKEANTYTNCSPPIKISKWSKNNSSLVEIIDDKILHSKYVSATEESPVVVKTRAATNGNRNFKSCSNGSISSTDTSSRKHPTTSTTIGTTSIKTLTNGIEVTKGAEKLKDGGVTAPPTPKTSATSQLISSAESAASTTPLPPTSTTPVPEDSIAKLEEVAAAPCEPWQPNSEPVDCISKLQAVAVPSDPWGSISTRSTLATTLLSADEIDDDDDDFEDDYEEEESIIPTYCPLRYLPFSSTASGLQQRATANYSPTTHGYGTRPNYYSEPFPQQNCSRTGSPHHLRMSNGGSGVAFPQWHQGSGGAGSNNSSQQFYVTPSDGEYPPQPQQQQQQTIRCAENGKSYLDLGCSTPTTSSATNEPVTATPPVNPYSNLHVASALEAARHPLKRCCEGRGTWCNANKNCYKDIRLKIRNLSMFKLSRFRQVSEQSLYRSVLICNTLKYIDREIEAEAKEIHQVAHAHAHAQHHQHTQYQHLHHTPHHMPPNHHNQMLHHNPPPPQPQLQQPQSQLSSQQHLHQQHQEYSPVLSCARVASMDYQVLQQHHSPQQQQQHFQNHPPPHPHHYHNSERHENVSSLPYLNTPQMQLQQKTPATAAGTTSAFSTVNNNIISCDPTSSTTSASSPLHPYDHYPFRESQSGRATPFPTQPVIVTPPPLPPASTTTVLQPLTSLSSSSSAVTAASTLSAVASATTSSSASTVVSTVPTTLTDADSGYGDDDCTRSINWSSVLSLSSQSALDPLNNNELFSIIPAPPTAVTTVAQPSTACQVVAQTDTAANSAVAISGSFTTIQAATAATTTGSNNCSLTSSTASPSRMLCNNNSSSNNSSNNTTTTATFTTLSTISSATYSMTSSYASSLSSAATAASVTNPASTWEYGFLDMDFGLGSEFTELMPSCKLSSEDLFKSGLTPVATSRYSSVHDNELEQPAHIMVGS